MNYREARAYLEEAGRYGSVLGLDHMKEMLRRLGNPQDSLKFIHIAGTNGKGSVLAYLSTVLKEAGYLVGRYISPTLFSYRERIQVNGVTIGKEALARLAGRIADVTKNMEEEGKTHPTVFEIETALGFLYFQEQGCDLVVLETGLGGLEDATNVVNTTIMEVITPISMDHMGFLGDTIREIAENKAGIIKPDTLVVSIRQQPEALEVIERVCREKHCSLQVADAAGAKDIQYGFDKQIFSYGGLEAVEISMAGSYQVMNAVLALEALKGLENMGYRIGQEVMVKGMAAAAWKGRFTILQKDPMFVIDGAHNADAAKVLKQSIELYFTNRRIFYIMGVFKDKEYRQIIALTAPLAKHIITVATPGNDRALPAEILAEEVARVNSRVEAAQTIPEAVEKSLKMAGKEDVIIAFGSLSFLGDIARAIAE